MQKTSKTFDLQSSTKYLAQIYKVEKNKTFHRKCNNSSTTRFSFLEARLGNRLSSAFCLIFKIFTYFIRS